MARIRCQGPLHFLQLHSLLTHAFHIREDEVARLKSMVSGQSITLNGPCDMTVTAADVNWRERGFRILVGPAYSLVIAVDDRETARAVAAIWVTVGEKQIIKVDDGEEEEAQAAVRRLLL